jgi:predicted ATPase
MKLIEREPLLARLETIFGQKVATEGHCVLVSGEAGIGKTSLVKAFCKQQENCRLYWGACDALFTPVRWRLSTTSFGR